MASSIFNTRFDNIEFSFVSKDCNVCQFFTWGNDQAMLPFHHHLFKVNIKIIDNNTKCFYHKGVFITVPDWISRKEQREYIHEVIMNEVKFCGCIKEKTEEVIEMIKSVKNITDKTSKNCIEYYKQNYG